MSTNQIYSSVFVNFFYLVNCAQWLIKCFTIHFKLVLQSINYKQNNDSIVQNSSLLSQYIYSFFMKLFVVLRVIKTWCVNYGDLHSISQHFPRPYLTISCNAKAVLPCKKFIRLCHIVAYRWFSSSTFTIEDNCELRLASKQRLSLILDGLHL